MNNSQQSIHDHPEPFQSMPLQPHLLPSEEHKVSIHIKPIQNFPSRDIFVTNNLRHSKRISMQQETPHLPSPSEKNKSFSDIISPQKIHTVVNLSLEKELDKHVHKSLNTMSEHSNIFEQSSIHKDENHKAATPSGFDLKEHDSLLNVDVVGEINSVPNKRACILCHNAPIVQTTITGSKLSTNTESNWEYDLIYPCLCNIKAHRECLKTYLLLRKIVACERCKTSYAVSGKTMRESGVSEKNRLRMIAILLMCIAIIAGGIVVIAILFSGSHPPVGVVGIVMVVLGILGIAYLVWKKYFSNKIVDIAVHCKQTEIARHRENPELTLKKFIAQEEKRRNSRVLKKAHKVIGLLDPVEFENFIKMVTPRTEKQEKMPNHERNGSVNFLLSEKKDHEDEENKLKARKEIFIAPTEVEKSENTMPDNPSNINEYSAKLRSNAIPQIRVTDSHPSKHVATYIRREPPRPLRPDMRRELSRGSQSERRYTDTGRRLQSARLVKPSFRDPLSAASIGTHGFTTRDRVDSPYLPVDGLRKQTEEEPKSRD